MVQEAVAVDTAEASASDTAAVEVPQELLAPDQEPAAATETATPEPTETESAPTDPFATLDDDALVEHPRVKSLVARHEESVRQRTEAQARRQSIQRDAEWFQRNEHIGEFRQAVGLEDGDDGQPRLKVDEKKFGEITDRLYNTSSKVVMGLVGNVFDELLPRDYTLTREKAAELESAKTAFLADSNAGPALLQQWIALAQDAAVKNREPELRKEIEKSVRAELAAKAKSAEIASADAERQPGPTRVTGTAPGRRYSSQVQVNTAHANGEITNAQKRAMLASGEFAVLPFQ